MEKPILTSEQFRNILNKEGYKNLESILNKPVSSEKSLHKAVCDYLRCQYPKVIFNTDLSGIKLTKGQAIQTKSLRSGKGFPDIMIFEPRAGKHGLFIELKREGEKIFKKDSRLKSEHLEEQAAMIAKLNERGYYATFCIGMDEAIKVIDWYLTIKK